MILAGFRPHACGVDPYGQGMPLHLARPLMHTSAKRTGALDHP